MDLDEELIDKGYCRQTLVYGKEATLYGTENGKFKVYKVSGYDYNCMVIIYILAQAIRNGLRLPEESA